MTLEFYIRSTSLGLYPDASVASRIDSLLACCFCLAGAAGNKHRQPHIHSHAPIGSHLLDRCPRGGAAVADSRGLLIDFPDELRRVALLLS